MEARWFCRRRCSRRLARYGIDHMERVSLIIKNATVLAAFFIMNDCEAIVDELFSMTDVLCSTIHHFYVE